MKRFTAVITNVDKWYKARCIDSGVMSQAETIEKALFDLER